MQDFVLTLSLALEPFVFGRKEVFIFIGSHLFSILVIIFVSASLKRLTYRQLPYVCIGLAYGLGYMSLRGVGFNDNQIELWAWLAIDGAIDSIVSYLLVRALLKPKLVFSTTEELASRNNQSTTAETREHK